MKLIKWSKFDSPWTPIVIFLGLFVFLFVRAQAHFVANPWEVHFHGDVEPFKYSTGQPDIRNGVLYIPSIQSPEWIVPLSTVKVITRGE